MKVLLVKIIPIHCSEIIICRQGSELSKPIIPVPDIIKAVYPILQKMIYLRITKARLIIKTKMKRIVYPLYFTYQFTFYLIGQKLC